MKFDYVPNIFADIFDIGLYFFAGLGVFFAGLLLVVATIAIADHITSP